MTNISVPTGYAPVEDGLELYYEIHGAGEPLRPAARRLWPDQHVRW